MKCGPIVIDLASAAIEYGPVDDIDFSRYPKGEPKFGLVTIRTLSTGQA